MSHAQTSPKKSTLENIQTLDLHFLGEPSLIASYLLKGRGDVVLVESGPGSTLPKLIKGLAQHNLTPQDVTHVLLTHIHLDHAGGAGWLASHGATVYVHHNGIKHLVDPSRLWASATRIYGEEMMQTLWGDMLPISPEQLVSLQDGDTIGAAGLTFTALDTPGHASHHIAYLVEDVCFTGDVTGCSMPTDGHIRLPTPPPDLDPAQWLKSLQRIQQAAPKRLYLTHFGLHENATNHLAQCIEELRLLQDFIEMQWNQESSQADATAAYVQWIEARAIQQGVAPSQLYQYENLASSAGNVGGWWRSLRKQREGQGSASN